MKKLFKIKFIAVLLSLLCIAAAYSALTCLKYFNFNEDEALEKWNPMVLNGKVNYSLIREGQGGYVQAFSQKTCSALYYKIKYNLKEYPWLSWKWKVLEFPDITKASTSEDRDDYAARVYVIFPFLTFSSSKFLEYVWSENLPMDSVIDSPFGNNVKMVVARNGKGPNGEWVFEKRNVYEDYLKAFGKEPSMTVGAVAIMCDADGTKTSARSFFDDITIELKEN